MKRSFGVFVLVILVVVGLIGCYGGNSELKPGELKPARETKDFVFVVVGQEKGYSVGDKKLDDILVLNKWLRTNPNKKVVSFSGVLESREDVSGYVVYFVSGNNSQQKFERINANDKVSQKHGWFLHGIQFIQAWKDVHPNARIVAISTVPQYSGGVKRFTICYEQ